MRYLLCCLILMTVQAVRIWSQNGQPTRILQVYFPTDVSKVDSNGVSMLQSYINENQLKDYDFNLIGYTDDVGSEKYNLKLSRQRAVEVKTILVNMGIRPSKIKLKGVGEAFAINEGDIEISRQKNRRVDIQCFNSSNDYIQVPIVTTLDLTKPVSEVLSKKHSAKYRKVRGKLSLKGQGNPKDVKIKFIGEKSGELSTNSDDKGSYNITLPSNDKYVLKINHPSYFSAYKEFALNDDTSSITHNIELLPLTKNQSIKINNISFRANRAIIQAFSIPVLENLKTQLLANPNVCFELQGHVNGVFLDPLTEDPFTTGLSISRAIKIYDELIAAGVHPARMTVKGYGHSRMIHQKPKTQEEHNDNMRVEIIILSCEEVAKRRQSEDKAKFETLRKSIFFRELDK